MVVERSVDLVAVNSISVDLDGLIVVVAWLG